VNVWEHAKAAGRDYITPEDVGAATSEGATKDDVWRDVLQAIEAKSAEDPSCCAFVALRDFGVVTGRDRLR
jgi:hypothetical protein